MYETSLLSGTTQVSLDTKGRLLIPVRYRQSLTEQNEGNLVVTRSLFDKCLWIYPVDEWDSVVSSLGQLPVLADNLCRTIQRVLLGSAVFCQLDVQGRILLPQELRDYTCISKVAYLIGFNNKFELWSEDNYKAQLQADDAALSQALSAISSHPVLSNLKL